MIIGWSFVERAEWLHLRFAMGSQTPGEIVCSYWKQPITAYDFRRVYGWEGDPDPLPMQLQYLHPGLYRNGAGREFRVEAGGAATETTVVPVLQPTKGVRPGTQFRWDSMAAVWEREYRTWPYWRSAPRILGAERAIEQKRTSLQAEKDLCRQ